MHRKYFYYLNERGNLYHVFDLEGLFSGVPKGIPSGPSFLRDPKFLNFFYQRLRRNPHFDPSSTGALVQKFASLRRCRDVSNPERAASTDAVAALLEAQLSMPSFLNAPSRTKTATRSSDEDPAQRLLEHSAATVCPFISHCGVEQNYIYCQPLPDLLAGQEEESEAGRTTTEVEPRSKRLPLATPIVFYDLHISSCQSSLPATTEGSDDANSGSMAGKSGLLHQSPRPSAWLLHAGGLEEPFCVHALRCSRDGRLFHPVNSSLPHWQSSSSSRRAAGTTRGTPSPAPADCLAAAAAVAAPSCAKRSLSSSLSSTNMFEVDCVPYGLVGAPVGMRLGLDYVCDDLAPDGAFQIDWEGTRHVIPFL